MVQVDTIEGTVDDVLWYHYDITNDVLYLRLVRYLECATCAEETKDGFLLLRTDDSDELAGLTVVGWWKRFGSGDLPDSLVAIERAIEPWAKRLAA